MLTTSAATPAFTLFELLGEAKVNQVQHVALFINSHQEVVGLDVAVDEALAVHELDPLDHLIGKHEDGLHCEPL